MSFHVLGRSTDVQTQLVTLSPSVFYSILLHPRAKPEPVRLPFKFSSSSRNTWSPLGIFMAPKRAPVEASSTDRKGKRTMVSRMRGTNKKTSDRQQPSDSNQNTSDGTQRTTDKGKRPVVEASAEVRKKATFDRSTFTTPNLAQRFHIHFSNRTVIPGRNIDFVKLNYFHFDVLFARMG